MKNISAFIDYSAGLVAGDGNITYPRRIRVFDNSREFLEKLCQLIKRYFDTTCCVY